MAKKKKIKQKKVSKNVEILKGIVSDFDGLGVLEDEEQLFILPTILPSFNRASLIGGLPGGCIVDLHGPNQGGKTALGLALLVSAQRQGYITGVLDYEGSFKDKKWPKALGVNLKQLLYYSPYCYEEGADTLNKIMRKFSNKKMLWLIDSINAMVPRDELEGNVGKRNFGLQASLNSQWLKILNTLIKSTNISIIFVNQERANVGGMKFAKKWKPAGGEALKFYAHFRVRVRQSSKVKVGDQIIGKEHSFVIEKNKVGAPDEEGFFYTSNGSRLALGWDLARTYFVEALEQMIIKKSESKKYKCDYDDGCKEGISKAKVMRRIREEDKFKDWIDSVIQFNLEDRKEEEDDSNSDLS